MKSFFPKSPIQSPIPVFLLKTCERAIRALRPAQKSHGQTRRMIEQGGR